jgi:hypothetical protein
VFLTQKVQNRTFGLDYGLFMPTVCDRNHDLRLAAVCFMVAAAPVTFRRADGNHPLSEGSGPAEATAHTPIGREVRRDKVRGGALCRCDVTARAALCSAPGSAAAIGLPAVLFTRARSGSPGTGQHRTHAPFRPDTIQIGNHPHVPTWNDMLP